MSYVAPVKDMLFNIQHLANIDQMAQIPGFEDAGSTPRRRCWKSGQVHAGRDRAAELGGRQEPQQLARRQGHHAGLQRRLTSSLPKAAGRACSTPPIFGWPGPAQNHWCRLRRNGQQRQHEFRLCPLL